MRHYSFLSDLDRRRLFLREPQSFNADSDPLLVASALGATLYCPATRDTLATDLARQAADGVVSMVACLEDAIADDDVAAAERHLVGELRQAARSGSGLPLVFVRVRNPAQITMLADALGDDAGALTGFVLPKFGEEHGPEFLDAVVDASEHLGRRLYAMPVVESHEAIFAETRIEALHGMRRVVDKYRDHVLAVRIGATDLSSAYGLRRSRDLTIYDVRVVADAIADIVNVFSRAYSGNVVTGPVWEYFSRSERIFKPQLRESPFVEHADAALRAALIAADLDGLIREVSLDQANGLLGKTVIHPSHVPAVHALSVVSCEEFADAADVLATGATGGATSSAYGNKMNESKPHTAWAQRTLTRSRMFGVAREGVSFVDLLGAGLRP
jgi:citrate lyase beta subunit